MWQMNRRPDPEHLNLMLRPYGLLLFPLIFLSAAFPVLIVALETLVLLGVDWATIETEVRYGERFYLISAAYFFSALLAVILSLIAFKKGVAGLALNLYSLCISFVLTGSRVTAGYVTLTKASPIFYILAGCLAVSVFIILFEKYKSRV